MFSFQLIFNAYKSCIKHKRNTLNAQNFEADIIKNLWDLQVGLENRSYKIGRSICFLTHLSKLREVFAADFKLKREHKVWTFYAISYGQTI